MLGWVKAKLGVLLARIAAFAIATYELVENTCFVRLVVFSARLWRHHRVPSFVMMGGVALCAGSAGLGAAGSFCALVLWQAPTLLAAAAAGLVFVIMLEVVAMWVLALVMLGLRLAYDIGRDAVAALLALALVVAMVVAAQDLAGPARPMLLLGVPVLTVFAAVLTALALWFDRVYCKPARPGFRMFWTDVVEARHALETATYEEARRQPTR